MAYDPNYTLQKVGPHIQSHSDAAAQWAKVAPVVKQMDGTDYLKGAKNGAITIFRKYFSDQSGYHTYADGQARARDVVNALGGFRPTYVETFNEIGQNLWDDLDGYIDFNRGATDVYHANGLKHVAYSFSVGTPAGTQDQMTEAWRKVAANNFHGADAIGLHEYANCNGCDNDWCIYRHRWVHNYLSSIGWSNHPPFLITETGIDSCTTPNCGGQGSGQNPGWRTCGWNETQMAEWCQNYDRQIRTEAYVHGAVVFGVAPFPNQWQMFRMDEVVPLLVPGAPPECTDPPACCDARRALCSLSGDWCNASCDEITRHVCCDADGCSLFVNSPIRQALCGSQQCPASWCSGPCPPCPRGHVPGCADCPCPACPHDHIEGCPDCPPTPTPRVPVGLLVGGALGFLGLALIAAAGGREEEVEVKEWEWEITKKKEIWYEDVIEINEDEPIPPGYVVVP